MCYKSSFWGLGYDNGACVEKLLVKLEYLSVSASTIEGKKIQKTRTQRQTLEFKEPQLEYCHAGAPTTPDLDQMKLRPNLPAGSWLVGTELINMINILTTEHAFTGALLASLVAAHTASSTQSYHCMCRQPAFVCVSSLRTPPPHATCVAEHLVLESGGMFAVFGIRSR